jgi:hypothetical protein
MKAGKFTLASILFAVAGVAVAQTQPAAQPVTGPSPAASVGLFAYPAKGQPAAQQATDETECYAWSKTQTGYDPKNPPKAEVAAAAPAAKGPGGERAKGAVRGAAAGAVIGEVADNDAGKGAAVGATVGVVAGGRQARKAQAEQKKQAEAQAQAGAEQAAASQQALADNFKRGMSACLESRGYTVK